MLPKEISDKYELRGTLGSGAMGVVYEALDRNIERRVAIKVVLRPPAEDKEGQEAHGRFRREAQAAGRLSHPNIVGVYDYGENAECSWIVMELVEGGTLKARFDRTERFPVAEAARLMDQVLGALAYSHARGVVHRDIKPGNIMLAPDGTGGLLVKIADFGIARLENSSLTQLGTVMGTPSYMAPEQLRGETVDSRADIWAAGVVLYQLLTGEKPFEGGGYAAVMHKALNTEATPPSQISVTAPRAFDGVVARALAKRPADRFTTAADFALAVRAAAAQPADASGMLDPDATVLTGTRLRPPAPAMPASFVPAPPPPAPAPAARGLPLAMVGGVAAVAVAALAWLGLSTSAPPPAAPPTPQATLAPAGPPAPDFQAAAEAVAALPCSLVAAETGPGSLRLAGLIRRDVEPALRQVLSTNHLPETAVQLAVAPFDGPYCGVLEQLRAFAAGAPRGSLLGTQPLQKGDLLRFEVTMPDRSGQLEVTYLMGSGHAAHIVPGQAAAANTPHRFGDPRPGFAGWEVDEPFGTDLLLALASDRPLFATPRPRLERIEDWLAGLAQALRQAEAQGNKVSALALVVPTRERR